LLFDVVLGVASLQVKASSLLFFCLLFFSACSAPTALADKGDHAKPKSDFAAAMVTVPTAEEWIPYTPSSEQVKLEIVEAEGGILLKVSMIMPHGGFRVEWGEARRENTTIQVEAKVEMWTGPAIQVITTLSHTYDLGQLPPGSYTIVFKANGQPVTSIGYQSIIGGLAVASIIILAAVAAATFALIKLRRRREG
jgi:hypothetical protein